MTLLTLTCAAASDDISGPITHSTGPSEEEGDEDSSPSIPLHIVVRINLARALRLVGRSAEAVRSYMELQAEGAPTSPEDACSFAAALAAEGQLAQAQQNLEQVIADDDAPRKAGPLT